MDILNTLLSAGCITQFVALIGLVLIARKDRAANQLALRQLEETVNKTDLEEARSRRNEERTFWEKQVTQLERDTERLRKERNECRDENERLLKALSELRETRRRSTSSAREQA